MKSVHKPTIKSMFFSHILSLTKVQIFNKNDISKKRRITNNTIVGLCTLFINIFYAIEKNNKNIGVIK